MELRQRCLDHDGRPVLALSSVPLGGATNTQTACMCHSSLHENATVYAQVRNATQ